MSQPLPVDGFKWVKKVSKIDEYFIKNYNEDRDFGYFLNVNIKCPRKLHNFHSDLPFLTVRIKINKCSKLVFNLHNK